MDVHHGAGGVCGGIDGFGAGGDSQGGNFAGGLGGAAGQKFAAFLVQFPDTPGEAGDFVGVVDWNRKVDRRQGFQVFQDLSFPADSGLGVVQIAPVKGAVLQGKDVEVLLQQVGCASFVLVTNRLNGHAGLLICCRGAGHPGMPVRSR